METLLPHLRVTWCDERSQDDQFASNENGALCLDGRTIIKAQNGTIILDGKLTNTNKSKLVGRDSRRFDGSHFSVETPARLWEICFARDCHGYRWCSVPAVDWGWFVCLTEILLSFFPPFSPPGVTETSCPLAQKLSRRGECCFVFFPKSGIYIDVV